MRIQFSYFRIHWKLTVAATVAAAVFLVWECCLPRDLFKGVPHSTIVLSRQGELLGARIADDGQWRFPECDSVPYKFEKAIIEFEDRTFYSHPGVSIRALARAAVQNLQHGRIVSGASTISMQVIRLSRRRPRTLWEKCVEMFMATRLEARYSKKEILCLYASYAPFGGNVVGLDAAKWRYLGSDRAELSWAQAATLAVLQNSPSLIRPDRNRNALLTKRNLLLVRLRDKGYISEDDCRISLDEPLMDRPYPMPQYAPHYVERMDRESHGRQIVTGIDFWIQQRVEAVTGKWNVELRRSGINDLAAVIFDIESGEYLAYCGNADMGFERAGKWVDIAASPRSSGSILKPLLYAAALQKGAILPQTILPDVPMNFGGFTPNNFNGEFNGAVPADRALELSLNIPNVQLLKDYGVSDFVKTLKAMGITTLRRAPDKYGLSLILGGAEVTLCDITSAYARMSAVYQDSTRYAGFPIRDRVAIYYTLDAMRNVNRPDQMDWSMVQSVQNIAWKTGTSYGARDAWAVGVTGKYAVGVWVGNADGSGVASLTGARTAGPVLFDIFNILPKSEWFEAPSPDEGERVRVCVHSGQRAGRYCDNAREQIMPSNAYSTPSCQYCKEYRISLDGKFRIPDRSEPVRNVDYFVLPPFMEHWYKGRHPEYVSLPPLKATPAEASEEVLHFIYPTSGSVLSLTKQLDGSLGHIVCKVAYTLGDGILYWHLDGNYLGCTSNLHEMGVAPSDPGFHILHVTDSAGNSAQVRFEII